MAPDYRRLRIWLNVQGRYGLPATDSWDHALERTLAAHVRRFGPLPEEAAAWTP